MFAGDGTTADLTERASLCVKSSTNVEHVTVMSHQKRKPEDHVWSKTCAGIVKSLLTQLPLAAMCFNKRSLFIYLFVLVDILILVIRIRDVIISIFDCKALLICICKWRSISNKLLLLYDHVPFTKLNSLSMI